MPLARQMFLQLVMEGRTRRMKTQLTTFVLLLAAAVALAACATPAPAAQAPGPEATAAATAAANAEATAEGAGDTAAEAIAEATTAAATEATGEATGEATAEAEETAAHDMAAHAGMNMDPATAFDLRFIDGMIPHHEGAIAMAQQALEQSERPEIKELAQAIIAAQQAEIEQLQAWRAAWYADAPASEGMAMDMGGGMSMMEVPAGEQPFDQRFIDSMIPHHEDAVLMSQEALTQAEHPEIKQLAQAIIDAQQREIQQLQAWRASWFPNQ
jgi:uncharacterized protein (DUF305 family)